MLDRLASPLLSIREAAARLGVGRTKMKEILAAKRIPACILDGRVCILASDVDAFKAALLADKPYSPDALAPPGAKAVAALPPEPPAKPIPQVKRSRRAPDVKPKRFRRADVENAMAGKGCKLTEGPDHWRVDFPDGTHQTLRTFADVMRALGKFDPWLRLWLSDHPGKTKTDYRKVPEAERQAWRVEHNGRSIAAEKADYLRDHPHRNEDDYEFCNSCGCKDTDPEAIEYDTWQAKRRAQS